MFRIKAAIKDQIEIATPVESVREFFREIRNLVDMMPGIESITRDSSGAFWLNVCTEIPHLGPMRAAFAVEQTENRPEIIEWSPAMIERGNFLRLAAMFEPRGARTLLKIAQHVELRRPNAKDLHRLAGLIGETRISAEMQKRIGEMIKTFLERARARLEGRTSEKNSE